MIVDVTKQQSRASNKRPVVILACNSGADYIYTMPLTAATWLAQGWEPFIIYPPGPITAIWDRYIDPSKVTVRVLPQLDMIKNFQLGNDPSIIKSQIYRLYAHAAFASMPETYMIMGDADMLLASDFLNSADLEAVNVYGHDLTGYAHIPMCYVGATQALWADFMGDDIVKHLVDYCDLRTDVRRWVADQDILTARVAEFQARGGMVRKVDRLTDPTNMGLPRGRIDRYNNLKHSRTYKVQDVHLPRQPWQHAEQIRGLLYKLYPALNWDWVQTYTDEFRRKILSTAS